MAGAEGLEPDNLAVALCPLALKRISEPWRVAAGLCEAILGSRAPILVPRLD